MYRLVSAITELNFLITPDNRIKIIFTYSLILHYHDTVYRYHTFGTSTKAMSLLQVSSKYITSYIVFIEAGHPYKLDGIPWMYS